MVSLIDAGGGFLDFSGDVATGAGDAATDAAGSVGGGLVDLTDDTVTEAAGVGGSIVMAPINALQTGAESAGSAAVDIASWITGGVIGAGSDVAGAAFGPFIDFALKAGVVGIAAYVLVSKLGGSDAGS